jgi:site-specific recombinase XerD
MLAQDGASLQLIGKVLNHSELRTTQTYARLTDDVARDALDRHAERLGKVIDLAAERAKRAG